MFNCLCINDLFALQRYKNFWTFLLFPLCFKALSTIYLQVGNFSYNYLTAPGKKAIAEAINDIFTKQMFEDLSAIQFRAIPLTLIIRDWMATNGISYEQEHNIIQKYTRIKDAYRKCGVNISRGYKHEDIGMNRRKRVNKR